MAFVEFERVPKQMNADAYKSSVNKTEPLCLIVNPTAGAGKAAARVSQLQRSADRAFAQWDLRLTEGPGHATELAREAVDQEFGIVAAVGGDGTCHEVMQGMVVDGRPRSNRTVFSTIPLGTGSDLMKSLEIPRNLSEALWVLATGITLPTDVGVARWTSQGQPQEELFINVSGFGANGEVVRRANASDKRLGGRATFMLASLRTTAAYSGGEVALEWQEEEDGPLRQWEGPVQVCFVANGAWCGGGMWVGRGGSMQDGLFDVTVLPPGSLARQLLGARHLYDGRLDRVRGALRFTATRLSVTPAPGAHLPLDLDGEQREGEPREFELLPAALQVRGGWIQNPVRGGRGRQFA